MLEVIIIQALLCVLVIKANIWNPSLTYAARSMPDNASIELLAEKNAAENLHWGCLSNTDRPHHSKNHWSALAVNKSHALNDPNFLSGTTFWVNEHMAVGHMMYDLVLLQVLQTTHIDRIVLQRAPCMNVDLCSGIGTFDSFYKGLYIAMMDFYQPGIPIFVRWTWQEKVMKPLYTTSRTPDGYLKVPVNQQQKGIHLKKETCMETLIRKPGNCNSCFYHSLSLSAINKFKEVAYSLVPVSTTTDKVPLPHHFSSNHAIVVTLAHRGLTASRHIANVGLMVNQLKVAFVPPMFDFRVVDTTNKTRGYAEQMRIVAESNIVIAEHGAFQSNVIYMRNGSLLLDLRGNYSNAEYINFEHLARMFGVYHTAVVTPGLESHRDLEFNITETDCKNIIDRINQYVNEKPYSINLK